MILHIFPDGVIQQMIRLNRILLHLVWIFILHIREMIIPLRREQSMAVPFVSGSACLLMQWGIVNENDPFLYGEKLKASLIRGAKRIKSARTYPNIYVGWGTLCVENSIR